ncbi:Structural maintenance of chromosomes protein 1 [Agyrium rufum]|nr:Structural maintenance of chromosomes protein 1 [Agyrium rufum]
MGKLMRLELFNFKSYKGHHVLYFGDSYFTSIIGPNGSGKSNSYSPSLRDHRRGLMGFCSMDAISFVLGIKSSHLRSSHLRDLVYRGRVLRTAKINEDGSATINGGAAQAIDSDIVANGSEATPSNLSQTQERNDPSSAWVMAVYEDDAGDEQYWKRSITNQGSSEYRINNRVVTAQQYNEAMEAENILVKARNFLVFQGDVEAIASQSPKDLTRLIEQISGSLEHRAEYERLKDAHEEAIENQNFNLNRRRGMNSEIKQYQEQKREADTYAKKADLRDEAIVTHVLYKLYHLQRAIDESTDEIKRHQEEVKEQRRTIAKYERNVDEAKKDQAKVAREIAKIERGMQQTEKQIEERENSLVPITEKIGLASENARKGKARVGEINQERDNRKDTIKRLTKDLKTVEKAEAHWEVEWNKASEKEGRVLHASDLQEYNRLREEVNKSSSSDQTKLDNLLRQQRADEDAVNSLRSKLDSLESQVASIEDERKDVQHHQVKTREIIQETNRQIDEKKRELNAFTSERLRLAQLRTELDEKLQACLIKLLEAEDGRKQSDKEIKFKAAVADMKRMFPGVKGRVSELCRPKQKKFEDAVSTVLGRHFDAVVVDNEQTAKDCIQYLREQRRGQATFIPYETISTKDVNNNLKNMKGCWMAIDTIDFDRSVERAMKYVCGNAIVCDTLATAKQICYEKGVEAKAVSLDGTVIHKAGLMTGGRGKEQRARWEDTEIENFRKLAEKLRRELSALPESRRNATEEESLQSELVGLNQKLSYANEEARAHDRNFASKKKELGHAKQQVEEVRPKYEGRAAEFAKLKDSIEMHRSAIHEVEDNVFSAFCERLGYGTIRDYESKQGSLQQEGLQKRLEFRQQRTRLEARINFEQQQLQETLSRIKTLENRISQDESLIDQLQSEKVSSTEALDTLASTLDEQREQLEERQADLTKKVERVAEQRREVQKRSKHIDGTLKAISSLEAEVQRSATDKFAVLRRCKVEDITIPLTADSEPLDKIPIDGARPVDPDSMDIDDDLDSSTLDMAALQDFGIVVDFDDLAEDLKEEHDDETEESLEKKITSLEEEMKKISPNMRAIERLEGVESKLKTTERDFESARKMAKKAKDDFEEVKELRTELFNKAFSHISEQIGPIYKELTRSAALPMGGQAYLDVMDTDSPFTDGITYHAMPPLKRFRDMEHLSGGEKTMAALALLFAIHSFQPSPFFVLDEVDAALDNANVAKIAEYIRGNAGPGMQFVVISLKGGLFEKSEGLVGVYRDQTANSSKVLTLDLRKYQ